MRLLISILILFISNASVAAEKTAKDNPKFDLRGMVVSQAVQLIYSDILLDSYVIDPEVLTDQRLVSFRYDSTKGDIKVFISAFFDSLGLSISRRGSVDYISKKIAPVVAEEVFLYRPKFRDSSYIVEILSPLFKGSFTNKRSIPSASMSPSSLPSLSQPSNTSKVAPVGSAQANIDQKTDVVIFQGSQIEIDRLKKILPSIDLAVGDVMVKGVLYEVQTSASSGSGFSFALNLLGSKFGIDLLGSTQGQSSVSFKSNTIEAVISALESDTRFKAVSKPTLRVRSGSTGRFTVGQDVPVLGSVSYQGAGQVPVQSVSYQSSGVILDIQPYIRDASIDLTVMQQTSNFVSTLTGVSGSPTLIKRELKTELNLIDGEVIVLGGLSDTKDSGNNSGLSFLPSFMSSKRAEKSGTEILLILQVTKL